MRHSALPAQTGPKSQALHIAELMKAVLFGVDPLDTSSLALLRALRVDPTETLRAE